jgi:hypothetical protein
MFVHKATFIVWFGAMVVHVLWYAPRLPRLLWSEPGRDTARVVLAGAGRRWLLLLGAIAVGLVIAMATYHLAGPWTGQPIRHG